MRSPDQETRRPLPSSPRRRSTRSAPQNKARRPVTRTPGSSISAMAGAWSWASFIARSSTCRQSGSPLKLPAVAAMLRPPAEAILRLPPKRPPCGEQMANPPADALQGAITHDNQTEGYYIVSGGTAFIDGKVVNGRRSTNNPDGGPNGPGCGGGVAVGSRKVELKVGDVLIVPPGVIHGWFDIPDHVDYL